MQLDIRHVNFPISDTFREFAREQVRTVLRPFRDRVRSVDVRLLDENGPRGGEDKRCNITAELTATKRTIVVKSTSANPYEAVATACKSLGESVSRALTRRRRLERTPASASSNNGTRRGTSHDVAPASEADGRIQVTTTDYQRLRRLIASASARDLAAAEALEEELDRADVVVAESIAGNVVTMNSRLVFEDEQAGQTREVSLVYPEDSDPAQGRISVLAPIGSALLGLSVGQVIDWPLPRGQVKRLRIIEITYQPEEAGHLHL